LRVPKSSGGAMGEVIKEGTSQWTAEDREAVAASLTVVD
jgi:hypothetical protein